MDIVVNNMEKHPHKESINYAVREALDKFDFEVVEANYLGDSSNAIFKIITKSNENYALRICAPGWRTEEDLLSEIQWLNAIISETEIEVPKPIMNIENDYLMKIQINGGDFELMAILFSWLPGELLANNISEENLYKMGILFAKLHQFSSRFSPKKPFTTKKMKSVFSRGEKVVIFDEEFRKMFTERTYNIFKQLDEKTKNAFSEIYEGEQKLIVVHNDLHHGNILVHEGELYPFDFEDTIWGSPIQDIAMALNDLLVDFNPDNFDALLASFRKGYEEIELWPESFEGQLDTFMASRWLWVLNWIALNEKEYLKETIDKWSVPIAKFLKNGKLRLNTN